MPDPAHLGTSVDDLGDETDHADGVTEAERLDATVRGKVQGVGFRRYVRSWARKLDLDGWVRNEPDGTVRLVAEGHPAALDRLSRLLWGGSPVARVDTVDTAREPIEAGWVAGTGFEIRR